MSGYYWNDWYSAWGWFLWFGVMFLFISSIGNWGYTYQAHRKYSGRYADKSALDILNERYAKGEITQDQYHLMKSEITRDLNERNERKVKSA